MKRAMRQRRPEIKPSILDLSQNLSQMCNEDLRFKLDKSATLPNQLESPQPSKTKGEWRKRTLGDQNVQPENFKNQSKSLDQKEQLMPQKN